MGFRTHLIHIRPKGGGYIWSQQAVDYFRSLVVGKTFRTIVLERTETPMPEGFPGTMLHIGVVMIQREPLGDETVQAAMVKAGFAEATGLS
jgi:hypothetical protein